MLAKTRHYKQHAPTRDKKIAPSSARCPQKSETRSMDFSFYLPISLPQVGTAAFGGVPDTIGRRTPRNQRHRHFTSPFSVHVARPLTKPIRSFTGRMFSGFTPRVTCVDSECKGWKVTSVGGSSLRYYYYCVHTCSGSMVWLESAICYRCR